MKGILVSYDYCTGCHSCEVACKKELGLAKGEFGIKVAKGKLPMCVQSCQAWCMAYGELEDLKGKIDGNSRYMFLTPLGAE